MQEKNNSFAIFQRNLASALRSKKWTQAQLAESSGVLQGNISNYLTGRREPKAAQLHLIAQALGVTMEWLLTGEAGDGKPVDASGPKPPNQNAMRKALAAAKAAIAKAESELDSNG